MQNTTNTLGRRVLKARAPPQQPASTAGTTHTQGGVSNLDPTRILNQATLADRLEVLLASEKSETRGATVKLRGNERFLAKDKSAADITSLTCARSVERKWANQFPSAHPIRKYLRSQKNGFIILAKLIEQSAHQNSLDSDNIDAQYGWNMSEWWEDLTPEPITGTEPEGFYDGTFARIVAVLKDNVPDFLSNYTITEEGMTDVSREFGALLDELNSTMRDAGPEYEPWVREFVDVSYNSEQCAKWLQEKCANSEQGFLGDADQHLRDIFNQYLACSCIEQWANDKRYWLYCDLMRAVNPEEFAEPPQREVDAQTAAVEAVIANRDALNKIEEAFNRLNNLSWRESLFTHARMQELAGDYIDKLRQMSGTNNLQFDMDLAIELKRLFDWFNFGDITIWAEHLERELPDQMVAYQQPPIDKPVRDGACNRILNIFRAFNRALGSDPEYRCLVSNEDVLKDAVKSLIRDALHMAGADRTIFADEIAKIIVELNKMTPLAQYSWLHEHVPEQFPLSVEEKFAANQRQREESPSTHVVQSIEELAAAQPEYIDDEIMDLATGGEEPGFSDASSTPRQESIDDRDDLDRLLEDPLDDEVLGDRPERDGDVDRMLEDPLDDGVVDRSGSDFGSEHPLEDPVGAEVVDRPDSDDGLDDLFEDPNDDDGLDDLFEDPVDDDLYEHPASAESLAASDHMSSRSHAQGSSAAASSSNHPDPDDHMNDDLYEDPPPRNYGAPVIMQAAPLASGFFSGFTPASNTPSFGQGVHQLSQSPITPAPLTTPTRRPQRLEFPPTNAGDHVQQGINLQAGTMGPQIPSSPFPSRAAAQQASNMEHSNSSYDDVDMDFEPIALYTTGDNTTSSEQKQPVPSLVNDVDMDDELEVPVSPTYEDIAVEAKQARPSASDYPERDHELEAPVLSNAAAIVTSGEMESPLSSEANDDDQDIDMDRDEAGTAPRPNTLQHVTFDVTRLKLPILAPVRYFPTNPADSIFSTHWLKQAESTAESGPSQVAPAPVDSTVLGQQFDEEEYLEDVVPHTVPASSGDESNAESEGSAAYEHGPAQILTGQQAPELVQLKAVITAHVSTAPSEPQVRAAAAAPSSDGQDVRTVSVLTQLYDNMEKLNQELHKQRVESDAVRELCESQATTIRHHAAELQQLKKKQAASDGEVEQFAAVQRELHDVRELCHGQASELRELRKAQGSLARKQEGQDGAIQRLRDSHAQELCGLKAEHEAEVRELKGTLTTRIWTGSDSEPREDAAAGTSSAGVARPPRRWNGLRRREARQMDRPLSPVGPMPASTGVSSRRLRAIAAPFQMPEGRLSDAESFLAITDELRRVEAGAHEPDFDARNALHGGMARNIQAMLNFLTTAHRPEAKSGVYLAPAAIRSAVQEVAAECRAVLGNEDWHDSHLLSRMATRVAAVGAFDAAYEDIYDVFDADKNRIGALVGAYEEARAESAARTGEMDELASECYNSWHAYYKYWRNSASLERQVGACTQRCDQIRDRDGPALLQRAQEHIDAYRTAAAGLNGQSWSLPVEQQLSALRRDQFAPLSQRVRQARLDLGIVTPFRPPYFPVGDGSDEEL